MTYTTLSLASDPDPRLTMTVVIPAYDEPELAGVLRSVLAAGGDDAGVVEVVVVVNHPLSAPPEVQATSARALETVARFGQQTASGSVRIGGIDARGLPDAIAGVGNARKIGMDFAHGRLMATTGGMGVIVNLDADCQVDAGYLDAIARFFENRDMTGASLYFEHLLDDETPAVNAAIVSYELFLRYYVNALRWAGHPHAFQTVGSAMAVRAKTYGEEGGMNRRKAAEDFYFLQKIICRQGFGDLVGTCVRPSPRPSARVPFGTGRSVRSQLAQKDQSLTAYAPETFRELRVLFDAVASLGQNEFRSWAGALADGGTCGPIAAAYWKNTQHFDAIDEIAKNCRSVEAFCRRFFRWFNLFRCRQFAHFARDAGGVASIPIERAAQAFLPFAEPEADGARLLARFRREDRRRPAVLDKQGFRRPPTPGGAGLAHGGGA